MSPGRASAQKEVPQSWLALIWRGAGAPPVPSRRSPARPGPGPDLAQAEGNQGRATGPPKDTHPETLKNPPSKARLRRSPRCYPPPRRHRRGSLVEVAGTFPFECSIFSLSYKRSLILILTKAFLHSGLSLLFALLLISLPSPALAGEPDVSIPPQASPLPLAADLPSCLGDSLNLSASTQQGPTASLAAILIPPRPKCGSCSSWDCVGITENTHCANGQANAGYCVIYSTCTADGSPQCNCRPYPQ